MVGTFEGRYSGLHVMKFIGLDGNSYAVQLIHQNNLTKEVSAPHERMRKLLKELFRLDRVWEEFPLPGTNPKLYFDFFIVSRRLAFEVHGKQHTEHVRYFHPRKSDFVKAKSNDIAKREWCKLNNITLIEVFDKETIDEWRKRILDNS